MPKFYWVSSALLIAAIACTSLLHLPASDATAQPTPGSANQLSWGDLFAKNPPTPPGQESGGSVTRGDICAIAPGLGQTQVWSDRPLFVWKGRVLRIAVRPSGSNTNLWSQPVKESQRTTPAQKGLQPGKTYEWLMFLDREGLKQPLVVPFQVMEAQQRQRIIVDLWTLERQLQGASREEIALAKANYFAQRQLWSDVLQQAYSVQNPSAELAKFVQKLPTQLCNAPASEQNIPSNR